MGCVSSKQTVSVTPAFDHSGSLRDNAGAACNSGADSGRYRVVLSELGKKRSSGSKTKKRVVIMGGEHVAAEWPAWLSAVAGEAIHGWVPLKADSYQKLEKILILRRLDHPNIIKLDGIVTSRMSCSLYLVFEYMEHDITGLLSCPDIKFSEPQIKCYMKQLLSGLDHCHSRGIIHRDIKGSNLLVNNEGILKMADFGLPKFYGSGCRQPLTSRVVTLWHRPPELLLGSTDYTAAVDLWSVGCVFSELLLRKPILQGRTEVEQLHKIFKLCGSPPDDYWKKARLPHATIFKPQQPYDSSLRDTFKDLPVTAVNLIETLLSVEPYKRDTASSALASEF
ncbi:putative serine/threonine-protein kinase [Hibiscus syriacus]|uniref:Serine/threonine-protein kinase n=1 Tax=Hibiscus syriacus TaxID=106335 RepID=A0A6A2WIU8_HIBSY|nr:putative serine/threonine-protein kinase [Hibiscus syriacus]